MSALTEDPAVTAWRLALVGSWPSAPLKGRHWWREYVTDAYRSARHAWWLQLEAATSQWPTEVAEYVAANPPPTFGQFLVGLSSGGRRAHG